MSVIRLVKAIAVATITAHYNRNLTTNSGDVTLHMPRLKGVSFETAITKRYRRRESSMEEALIEMCLAGVSVRRLEDITEALWGSKVSPTTISELNKKPTFISRTGGTALCRVDNILMYTCTEYICVATGAESMKMWLFWWQLP